MYKDRFKKWNFYKNKKEHDMVAILRKKTERDAVGKDSSFRVRGQPVTMDVVLRYFKRKKGTQDMRLSTATTPSGVSCRTPSPLLGPTPQPIDNGIQVVPDSSRVYRNTFALFASANNDAYADVSGGKRTITPPFIIDKNITRSARSGIGNFLSKSVGISRSPSPPPTLLVPELLLVKIKTYFEGSIESEIWITDESGYSTNIASATATDLGKPINFRTYIRMAAELLEMGSLVEFRRVLSKAFNLVEELLREEHPLTLCCFLDVIVHLLQRGRPEIVSLLRSYIKGMATRILPREKPWGHICRLMGMLGGEFLEQAIVQCWKCTHDTFKHGLGPFHPSTVNILMLLTQCTLNIVEEEKMLRELVAQSEHASGVTSSSLTMLMIRLGFNLKDQGEFLKGEELGWQILGRAEITEFQKIEALELIAWMQYYQNKMVQAEKTMRDVIDMIVDQWGVTDPWAINNSVYLEQWLRSWGREEDAYKLKADREVLIGKDEIDE
jgi:hypothetical protein